MKSYFDTIIQNKNFQIFSEILIFVNCVSELSFFMINEFKRVQKSKIIFGHLTVTIEQIKQLQRWNENEPKYGYINWKKWSIKIQYIFCHAMLKNAKINIR